MKTLYYLGLSLLLLSLFACKKHLPHTGELSLTIWHSYNNEENAVFQKIISRYAELNPGTKIRAERVPFDGLLPKLITAAIAGKTPDIARLDLGHIARLAWGKAIEPLESFGAEELIRDMHPIARSVATVALPGEKPQIFAVPDQLTTVALFYNKDILREAGVNPPKNLEELRAMGKIFRDRRVAAKPLGINVSLWWLMPWLYLFDAKILSHNFDKCRLGEKAAVDAVSYLRRLYAVDKSEGGAWISGGITPDQGFITGRYAMVLSGPWNLKAFKQVNFGVSLVPASTYKISASNIGGSAMVVFKKSEHKEKAFHFLKYLSSVEVQEEWSRGTGQLSVNREAATKLAPTMSQELKVFLRQLRFADERPQLPGYDSLELIVGPYLYSAMDGSLPVDEALKKACREVQIDLLDKMVK